MKEGLGVDAWDELKKSCLGVFIKFDELEYTWAASKVHYILTHQLRVKNCHEIWSLMYGRPIRFSLNEFVHITGLYCDPIYPLDNYDGDHYEFWKEMKLPTTSDGPKYCELLKVMDFCKTWSLEKRVMVGKLILLFVEVNGISHSSRVPVSGAKQVLDPIGFEKHPWGRVAFTILVDSVKIVAYDNDSYTICECVHALLIWLYANVCLLC